MSYLLDRKIKRKKFGYIFLCGVFFLILVYFRTSIFYGLSYATHEIFRPVLYLGRGIGNTFSSINSSFVSKDSLFLENENLKNKLNENEAKVLNYAPLFAENILLKEILGRKNERINMTLAGILSKPNQSFYNTLIIDIGIKEGVKIGDIVFALGNIPIGKVDSVYDNTSKIVLFSSSREKTEVVLSGKDIFMEIIGRGGGNFEMVVPSSVTILKGDQVVLPGINLYVLGVVETIISDPRDSFVKAILSSPVNIQELKFVEVSID